MILFFDFTIIDDKNAIIISFLETFKKIGHPVKREAIHKILGKTMKETFNELIPEHPEKERIVNEAIRYMQLYIINKAYKLIKPCKGIDIINRLKEKWKIFLVTNNSRNVVDFLLKKLSINIEWDEIITPESGYVDKIHAFKTIIKKEKVNKNIFYIGDMVRDIIVARKAGIKIISIPGWDKKETLLKKKPDYLINNLKELPELLESVKT